MALVTVSAEADQGMVLVGLDLSSSAVRQQLGFGSGIGCWRYQILVTLPGLDTVTADLVSVLPALDLSLSSVW